MKRILASCLATLLLATPVLALAQSTIPIGQNPAQSLTTMAAVGAQEASAQNGTSLACDALFSTSTVPLGQQVILAWGSVGSVPQTADPENMWPAAGALTLSFTQIGTWTYYFKFYDASGNNTLCTATIIVR